MAADHLIPLAVFGYTGAAVVGVQMYEISRIDVVKRKRIYGDSMRDI
jgi:hypothetical protein